MKGKKKPNGYWKDIENVKREVERVMNLHGLKKLPSQKELCRLGEWGIPNAISKLHGGFHKFRKLIGEEQIVVESRRWEDIDFTIEQAKRVMEENKFEQLPSAQQLSELGKSSLACAITKYYGGMHKFRKLLGQEPKKI